MNALFLLPWHLILEIAPKYGLDPHLVAAIILTESGAEVCAMRYEPKWRYPLDVSRYAKITKVTKESELVGQSTSWGLLQVMGTVAREHGFNGLLPELCDPRTNLEIGCAHLRDKIEKYKGKISHGVAAYNAGSARFKANGELVNQKYPDKVLSLQNSIKLSLNAVNKILE